MAKPTDPRRVIGARVTAKATMVTSLAECARRYGANKKKTVLEGTVTRFFTKNTQEGRVSHYITAIYDLGGGTTKKATINSRSVHAVPKEGQKGQVQPPPTIASLEKAGTAPNTRAPEPPTCSTQKGPNTGAAEAAATPNQSENPPPVAKVHVTEWNLLGEGVDRPINGSFGQYDWSIKVPSTGSILKPGCELGRNMSKLDYFLLMFPPEQLNEMTRLTNINLQKQKFITTTKGEVLKWFGLLILGTRYEFSSRHDLWKTTAIHKYIPAPCFGVTGMYRNRFDELWKCMCWSHQPDDKPDSMSHREYRWMLVDDFVDRFNEYRTNMYTPSSIICVDESILRWYGMGGEWINMGLPIYIAIDRKPEKGAEVQNSADGKSGIMMRWKVVKHDEVDDSGQRDMLYGTQVLLELVIPWAHTNRLVCGDSYFTSVPGADELYKNGFSYIGVVKSATRHYPIHYLSTQVMFNRGDQIEVIRKKEDGVADMCAWVWMDRDRRYFLATGSSLGPGVPYVRQRWRQLEDVETNISPELIELTVPQPLACQMYYSSCGIIDRHCLSSSPRSHSLST